MKFSRTLRSALAISAAIMIGLALWEPLTAEHQPQPPQHTYAAEIIRDEFGVPHIFGKTDADAAYGLAYAHAEDDFETLQAVIAMTRGRMGALRGADGAKVDYAFHLLGARETAHTEYPRFPQELRATLEGYASGLNLYATKHPNEVALRHLFPTTGEDVATGFILRAPFFFGLDKVMGKLAEGEDPPTESAAPMTPTGRDPEMNGSNAFAIAPKRMADGKTWLISNSHQPYEGDVAWYEASLHSDEGLNMAGALFPGSPFLLLGHNRNLGWTNTVNLPDLIDVYALDMDDLGENYRMDGEWKPLEHKRVWLKVRFGPFVLPVPKMVYRSEHGPVIRNKKGFFAIRYAGIGSARNLEQYYRIEKARDWNEWTRAMALGGIQSTNFIYADKTGRIAFIYNAGFPDRRPGYDYTKVLPGDISADLWRGALGFAAMPKIVSPASGFVVNSNNTPFIAAGQGSELDPKQFSPLLGIERRVTNRIIRSVELLSADPSLTREELLRIKFDEAYSRKSFAGPWLARILAVDPKGDHDIAAAQDLLREWDWTSDGKGRADALAELLLHAAARQAFNGQPFPNAREALTKATLHLMTHFGRLDPPLGELQRLVHGQVDIPIDGGTDTLRASTSWDDLPNGRKRVKHGDSFIMLINWDRAGKVRSESVQPYGAATSRPDSPHHTDQMQLYATHRFKPVHFERADILAHAKQRSRI